jgi:hypothetical protein
MKFLKDWKDYSDDYETCTCGHHYDNFLLENTGKIIQLHEFVNGIKYNQLVSRNNSVINSRGGTAVRGAGYGQNIENPPRSGKIDMVYGAGQGEARTRRFIYKVPSDDWPNSKEGPYTVTVQFSKDGPRAEQLAELPASERLKQLDVMVKCNCPFFIWNGPEYNAERLNYLYPAGQGRSNPPGYNPRKARWNPNMTSPSGTPGYWAGDYANTSADQGIRDPNREYYICKHVAAVFNIVDSFLRLPVSYYRAAETDDLPDPGYPGSRRAPEQPVDQLSFVFPSDQEQEQEG